MDWKDTPTHPVRSMVCKRNVCLLVQVLIRATVIQVIPNLIYATLKNTFIFTSYLLSSCRAKHWIWRLITFPIYHKPYELRHKVVFRFTTFIVRHKQLRCCFEYIWSLKTILGTSAHVCARWMSVPTCVIVFYSAPSRCSLWLSCLRG